MYFLQIIKHHNFLFWSWFNSSFFKILFSIATRARSPQQREPITVGPYYLSCQISLWEETGVHPRLSAECWLYSSHMRTGFKSTLLGIKFGNLEVKGEWSDHYTTKAPYKEPYHSCKVPHIECVLIRVSTWFEPCYCEKSTYEPKICQTLWVSLYTPASPGRQIWLGVLDNTDML